jgi:multiple antibiotic resistance protein
MPETAVSAFVLLFVTIGPVETAAVFGVLTAGTHRPERRRLAWQAVVIAGLVLLLFALVGNRLLDFLHVSLAAFRIAGGVLLLLLAVDLVFAHPTGLSSITPSEEHEAQRPGDIAVFPLAIPLIAGPGSMTAIVLLMGQAATDLARATVLATLVACLGATYVALVLVDPLGRLLGVTGTNVVARISGILLAAVAVQFVLDGVREANLFGSASP